MSGSMRSTIVVGMSVRFPCVNGTNMSGGMCSTIVVGMSVRFPCANGTNMSGMRSTHWCKQSHRRGSFEVGTRGLDEIAKPQKAVTLSDGGSVSLLPDHAERHES